jgi:hypothetical protein
MQPRAPEVLSHRQSGDGAGGGGGARSRGALPRAHDAAGHGARWGLRRAVAGARARSSPAGRRLRRRVHVCTTRGHARSRTLRCQPLFPSPERETVAAALDQSRYFAAEGQSWGATTAHWPALRAWATAHSKLWVASVAPGYHDERIRPWNGPSLINITRGREAGAYYRRMWGAASGGGGGGAADAVAINSCHLRVMMIMIGTPGLTEIYLRF